MKFLDGLIGFTLSFLLHTAHLLVIFDTCVFVNYILKVLEVPQTAVRSMIHIGLKKAVLIKSRSFQSFQ